MAGQEPTTVLTAAGSETPARSREWTEPGAHRVAEGVYRIPLPLPMDGLRAVNVYALETTSGLTLVDGGWAVEQARTQFEQSLREIGYRLGDIRSFLVTHVHRDHYTQAIAVRREFGSRVSLGVGDRESLAMVRRGEQASNSSRLLERAGAPGLARTIAGWMGDERSSAAFWEEPDTWLEGDHTVDVGARSLEAISTPGHTQGHFVFADLGEGLLFAGDHVLPTITPSIGFEAASAELPLGDFLQSLAKVRRLPDLRLLPAHGPVTPSSHARVDDLLAHHKERLDLCVDALTAGPDTAHDIARQLPWTRRSRRFADLDPYNAALATLETAAHLDLLAAQGRVGRAEENGVAWYSGPPSVSARPAT